MQLESGEELGEQGVVVELPLQSGSVLSLDVHRFERRDGGMALRAFVTCSDHALHLISSAGRKKCVTFLYDQWHTPTFHHCSVLEY